MRGQDIVFVFFALILTYLVVKNWRGATALLQSGGSVLIGATKTLQGR
jgi:hypothetical protein